MENTAHSIECDADARPPAFRNFRPIVQQQCFNVRPGNVGSLFEDGFQHSLVFSHLDYDINK